jgi:hypothetical protein
VRLDVCALRRPLAHRACRMRCAAPRELCPAGGAIPVQGPHLATAPGRPLRHGATGAGAAP